MPSPPPLCRPWSARRAIIMEAPRALFVLAVFGGAAMAGRALRWGAEMNLTSPGDCLLLAGLALFAALVGAESAWAVARDRRRHLEREHHEALDRARQGCRDTLARHNIVPPYGTMHRAG